MSLAIIYICSMGGIGIETKKEELEQKLSKFYIR